ncbi:MAG TPA: hypothetical protein VFB96_23125 [Pirellulaceae bacterium]|nr:hypothetical protein [Pirellulaceae bacterium]
MRRALASQSPVLGWSLVWLVIACWLVTVPGNHSLGAPGDAAGFKTLDAEIDPVYKNAKELRDRTSKVRSIISGSLPLSGNETLFDEHYTKYVFPSSTLTTEANLGSLAKNRENFLRDIEKAAPQVHDRLADLAFTHMLRIAKDPDLHPGARYNAVLVLGALNAKEADRVNKVNPEPLPKALPELVALYKDPDQSDAVKVAALLGILRQLEWDAYRKQTPQMNEAAKTEIVTELIALAEATKPPAGRSEEGHTWMRRRAVEGLMYAALPGTTKPIADVIEKLIGSAADPVALRCTAADVMGRLDYKEPVLPAPEPTARELGYLALVACNAELLRLEDRHKQEETRSKSQNRFSGALGGGMGGMGGGAGGAVPGGGMRGGMMSPGMEAMGGIKGKGPPNMAGKMMTPGGGMMSGKGAKKGKNAKSAEPMGGAAMPLDMMQGGSDLLAPADPKAYRLDNARRRMRAWLYAVQMGLGDEANPGTVKSRAVAGGKVTTTITASRGVAAYAKTEQDKSYIADVIAKVHDVIKVVEDPDREYDEFVSEVRDAMKELEGITKPLEESKPEPAATADDVPGSAAPARAAAATKGKAAPPTEASEVPDPAEVPGAAPVKPATEAPAAAPPAANGTKGAPPSAAAPDPAATKSP